MGWQPLVSRVRTLWMLCKLFGLKILICISVTGRVEMWRRVWPSAVVPAISSAIFGLDTRH